MPVCKQRRYVHKNLSVEVRKIATFVFHLLSHVSETSCFVLLGLSVFLVDFPLNRLPFMVAVLLVCSVTRPLSVYPLIGLVSWSGAIVIVMFAVDNVRHFDLVCILFNGILSCGDSF